MAVCVMDRTQQGEREGGTNTDCLHAGCSTYTPLQAVWSAHAQGMIRKRAMSARVGVRAVCDGDGRAALGRIDIPGLFLESLGLVISHFIVYRMAAHGQ